MGVLAIEVADVDVDVDVVWDVEQTEAAVNPAHLPHIRLHASATCAAWQSISGMYVSQQYGKSGDSQPSGCVVVCTSLEDGACVTVIAGIAVELAKQLPPPQALHASPAVTPSVPLKNCTP